MYDICCIGHITSDRVINAQTTMDMPGGTALYFSCAVSKLDMNYLLITSVGNAEIHYVEDLRQKGLTVAVQAGTHTVYFENIYAANQDERTQNVLQKADPFLIEQVKDISARIFHLGPLLADDMSAGFVKGLAGMGKISLDVQGYLRKVIDKNVHATQWLEKDEVLPYIDILKADVAELAALTGCNTVNDGVMQLTALGVKEIVITNGSRGSLIYTGGTFYTIPAYMPGVIIDATGCGDTYMAGYLYKRVKGAGIQESGEFAAAVSGLKAASPGPFLGTEADVNAFMQSQQE